MNRHPARMAVLALPLFYIFLVACVILFRIGEHPGFVVMFLTWPWSLIPMWVVPGAFGPRPQVAGGDELFMASVLIGAGLNAYILFWLARLATSLVVVVTRKQKRTP